MNEKNHAPDKLASVSKQFLAITYDSLLLLAVLFLANAVLLIFLGGQSPDGGNPLMSIYLIVVSYVFFAWFWTHGGQTLGMRAWRLKLVQHNSSALTWPQTAIRFFTAVPAWIVFLLGVVEFAGIKLESHTWLLWLQQVPDGIVLLIALVWLYIDHRPNNWRDKLSGSHVIQLNKSLNT